MMSRSWLLLLCLLASPYLISCKLKTLLVGFDVTESPDLFYLLNFIHFEKQKLTGCHTDSSRPLCTDSKCTCPRVDEEPPLDLKKKKFMLEVDYREYWSGRMALGIKNLKPKEGYVEMMLKKNEINEKQADSFHLFDLYDKMEELQENFPERLIFAQMKRTLEYYVIACPCEHPSVILSRLVGMIQLLLVLLYELGEAPCTHDVKIPYLKETPKKGYYGAIMKAAMRSHQDIEMTCKKAKLKLRERAARTSDEVFATFYNLLSPPVPDLLEGLEIRMMKYSLDWLTDLYEDLLSYSKNPGYLPEVTRFMMEEIYAPTEFAVANFFNDTLHLDIKLYLVCSYGAHFLQKKEWTYTHLPARYQNQAAESLIGVLLERVQKDEKINPFGALAKAVGVEKIAEFLFKGILGEGCPLTDGGLYLDHDAGYLKRKGHYPSTLYKEMLKFSGSKVKQLMENYGIPEILKFEKQAKLILDQKLDWPPPQPRAGRY